MTLAVCLITADRHEMTANTVESFVKFHPGRRDMILLHADDGSVTNYNFEIAKAAGFETVFSSKERRGALLALWNMWKTAECEGATHILHLENDQEFVAPIPDRRDATSIRLYGEFKERDASGPRARTGPHIMGTKEKIKWSNDGHEWQRTKEAHWGGQASITEIKPLIRAMWNCETFKDLSMSPHLNRIETLRPRDNITWHIGGERTPGGVFN